MAIIRKDRFCWQHEDELEIRELQCVTCHNTLPHPMFCIAYPEEKPELVLKCEIECEHYTKDRIDK